MHAAGRFAEIIVVSILVVLDWVLRRARQCSVEPGVDLFQSLLYWIGCCDSRRCRPWLRRPSGFNPCCIGLGVATVLDLEILELPTEFQSLLYWIGCCDVSRPSVMMSGMTCFNPCCIGLGVATPGMGAKK